MRSWAIALLLLGACKYSPPQAGQEPGDGRPTDGEIDSAIDADLTSDAMVFDAPTAPSAGCFGTFVQVCLPTIPTADRNIGSLTISTDNMAACDPVAVGTNIDACVIAGDSIILDGTLRATGSRPLILLATRFDGQIIINGQALIDVGSHRVGITVTRGAGANPTTCNIGAPTGAGGGGGAAFGGNGGNGGNGNGGSGGSGQSANAASTLRGGCPGSRGGNDGGDGGNGGGAVALISKNVLINGKINASGAGGGGGGSLGIAPEGGGGGGSGGFIVIDTTNTTFNSCTFMAQGGGGGQGSLAINPGEPGDDPSLLTVGIAANGGNAIGPGGTGGAGGTSGNAGNAQNSGAGGGGGGGGSTGRIHNIATTTQGSPTQTSPNVVEL